MAATFKKLMLFTSALAAGATSMAATEAQAQSGNDDTVVVTATRREQALQDIPLAVTAVNAEQLKQANVTSTADLMRVAPTLQIQSSNSETGGSTIRIRGVGTTGNNIGLEGAVGVFIDGVYRQRAGLAMNNLFDIGRIEVLRGPQGTLFGKNTSAGAITVTPNLPRLGEFDASVNGAYGNFNNIEAGGMINLPVGDSAALRVSGAYQSRDGYVEDVRTGQDNFSRDRRLGRAQFMWEPSDNITWRAVIDYSEKDENCCAAVYSTVGGATLLQNSLVGVGQPPRAPGYNSITTAGRDTSETTEDMGFTSHLSIDLGGDITFKNIIAYRKFDSSQDLDADFGAADIVFQRSDSEQTLASAEFTLNGTAGNLDWLFGGYYADETVNLDLQTRYGADLQRFITAATGGAVNAATAAALYPTAGGNTLAVFDQDARSWSIFTHNQIDLTEKFGAVVGFRYNHEEKNGGLQRYLTNSPSCGGGPFDGQGAAAPPGLNGLRLLCPRPTYEAVTRENKVTGTGGLNYDLTDDILLYTSYSHGYKAGGINLDRDAPVSLATPLNPNTGLVIGTQAQVNQVTKFAPEFSDSWEFGVRAQFWDRTLTTNFTYFDTDYDGFQLNTFNGLGFVVANAGSVNSRGFELEGNWLAGEGLTFQYGVSHVVAKYGFDPLLAAAQPPTAPPPFPANPALAGRTLTNAPKWALSSGVHYEHALFSDTIKGFFDLSASYRTTVNTGSNLNPTKIQPALTLINARVGLFQDTENGWELSAFGTNLTDEYYTIISFDTVFQAGSISDFPGAPRMYGIRFTKDF